VGPHYKGGKRYVPGDIIELHEHQAQGIMFKLEQLDPSPPPPEPEVSMMIVEIENDMFDVVNEITSERINDSSLTLSQAKSLVGEDVPIQYKKEVVDPPKIKAFHRGGGRYILVYEETQEKITNQYFKRAEAAQILKKIESGEMNISNLTDADE
jgi:hypothetical protein